VLIIVGTTEADEAYVIGKRGQYTPVGAYLAGDEIIKIALDHGVQMIHPGKGFELPLDCSCLIHLAGYGFLSENAGFARNVEKAGLIVRTPQFL
jgi:pyruvate carboxylase